jgi:hypothetical protein
MIIAWCEGLAASSRQRTSATSAANGRQARVDSSLSGVLAAGDTRASVKGMIESFYRDAPKLGRWAPQVVLARL